MTEHKTDNDPKTDYIGISFGMVPQGVTTDKAISEGARFLLCHLFTYRSHLDRKAWPGQQRLADELGLTRMTISKRLKELEERGWITSKRRGITKTNVYTIYTSIQLQKESDVNEGLHQDVKVDLQPDVSEGLHKHISKQTKEQIDSMSTVLSEILSVWNSFFPEKPKPRLTTKSICDKVKTRLKNKHFQNNWQLAMEKASKNSALHEDSWFDFRWFVKNDDNYQKVLEGKYDWKDKKNGSVQSIEKSHPPFKAGDSLPGQ